MVAMAIFHRSSSSYSSPTSQSNRSSIPEIPGTSRVSEDDGSKNNRGLRNDLPGAPILSLPIELIQHITSYLGHGASASFSLSSRYIYYALGSDCLTRYINSSKNRFAKRQTIEAVVERAFPGHWFCAWCDVFHAWSVSSTRPDISRTPGKAEGRNCLDFNSYLNAGDGYVLRFHHVRLALAHAVYGPSHGIPLSSLTYTSSTKGKIYGKTVLGRVVVTPKLCNGRVLLKSAFSLIFPACITSRKNILSHIWPILPHILVGHRDSENGHTGLMAAIDNVVRRGWTYPLAQNCGRCLTDWSVGMYTVGPHRVQLVVESWRDLGDGKSPFEQGWRAHGVPVVEVSYHAQRGVDRYGEVRAGDVRRAFEEYDDSSGPLVKMGETASSPVQGSIYRAFMRKDIDGEVRRSRTRKDVGRTGSEMEEGKRHSEEERREVARQVAESLVRLDAWRRTRA